jgi:hypothetical protein
MREGFCAYSFSLETLDSASETLLKGVIEELPDKAIHTFAAFTKILFCKNQMTFLECDLCGLFIVVY